MAVTSGGPSWRVFARLKLRVLGNGLRGKGWRIALFVLGCLAGLWFAALGFIVFALTAVDRGPAFSLLVPAFGGTAIVLGWLFGPLIWAGVDETLEPARFALLPLPRRTLVGGLLVAGLLGIPAVATLVATCGLLVGAVVRGGPVAGLVQLVGVGLGLLLCLALSRAVTSAFASLLRARRTRDLAAVALALLAALLGPLQVGAVAGLESTSVDRLAPAAEVLGWTPLAAPYLVGQDVAAGDWPAVAVRLAITLATLGLLMWWWSRSLASAMLGTVAGGSTRSRRVVTGGPVDQLYPRLLPGLPRTRAGALVVREVRYWWRDARRRANLIVFGAVSLVLPVMAAVATGNLTGVDNPLNPGGALTGTILLVGSLAAVTLANQFGLDGSAYAGHLIAGVPGRVELRARVLGFSVFVVPLLVVVAILAGVLGDPVRTPAMLGGLLAIYGTGLAVNLLVSILGPYSFPESANPFAIRTGGGMAKSLLSLAGMSLAVLTALPVVVPAALLDGEVGWVLLPVGAGYGFGAAVLGIRAGGALLDRRAPEVLAAVTPSR